MEAKHIVAKRRRKAKPETTIVPGRPPVPSSDTPAIAEVLSYAITEASESGRGHLALKYAAEASERRRDALDALRAWVESEAESRAIALIREHAPDAPRHVSQPPHVVKVAVPAEILKDEMQPYFVGNLAQSVIQLLPERRGQWAKFFKVRGCLSCHKRERPHVANGLCERCYSSVANTLQRVRGMAEDELVPDAKAELPASEPEPLKQFTCLVYEFRSKPVSKRQWVLVNRPQHERGSRHQRALREQGRDKR